MGNKFEEAISSYQDLKKSGVFQKFLEEMSQIFDSNTNPIMDEAEKNLKPEEKKQSIFNIPFSNPEEMNKISTSCLLTKAKTIIDELKKPIPETMGEEEKQTIYERSKLPATLVEIKKAFDKRYAAVMKKFDNKEDKNFDEKFPDDATFNEFRLYNTGKQMIDKLGDISLDMYNGINFDKELEKGKADLFKQVSTYENDQDRVIYEFNAYENAVEIVDGKPQKKGPLNLGKVYSEADGEFVELVISRDLRDQDPDFFFDKEEGLHKWEQYFVDEVANESKNYSEKVKYNEAEYKQAVTDTEAKFKKIADGIYDEYAELENEQLELHESIKKRLGNKSKVINDYKEYNDYYLAKEQLSLDFEMPLVSEQYKRYTSKENFDEYFKSNDESYYTEELDKVNEQIATLENEYKSNQNHARESADSLKSAEEINKANSNVGVLLDEADIEVAEQLAALSKAMHTKSNLTNIQDFDKKMFATTHLTRAREDAIRKYDEIDEYKKAIKNILNEPISRKEKYIDNFVNSIKGLIQTNKEMVESSAYKKDQFLQAINLSTGIKDTDITNLQKAYNSGDETKIYESVSKIIKDVNDYRENIRLLKSNENLKDEKALKKGEKAVDAIFNNENVRLIRGYGENIVTSQSTYQSKIEAIKNNIKETFDEKVKQRADIENFKANEIRENNKRIASIVSESELNRFKQEKEKYEAQSKIDKANIDYLKNLKGVLEKGKVWYKIQAGLPSQAEHQRYEELTNILEKRKNRITDNDNAKTEKLNELKKEYDEQRALVEEKHLKENKDFCDKRDKVREAIKETKHIRTALTNVRKNAKKIQSLQNKINHSIRQETRSIESRYDKKFEKNKANENRLLSQVLKSAKKFGPDSDVFKNLKTAITNYQNSNDPQNYKSSDKYRNATTELNTAIQAYIDARGKGSRWTKQGQLRLEYVKSLQNCLKNNLEDIKSYEKELVELTAKKPQTEIKPKSQMEYRQNSSLEKAVYGDTYAKLNNQQISALGNGHPLTEEQEKAFSEMGLEEDRIDASLDNLNTTKLLEKATKEAYEKMENPEEEAVENEPKAVAVIPEIEFIKPVNPDWEKEKEYQPEEIVPIVEEFNKIMENVPNDYGFDTYNSGHLFKKSLENYKKENLAAEQFMKDNNLHNPKLSKKDCEIIAKFDRENGRKPNFDFGYKEYVLNELKSNNFPMGKHEFVQKKFNIKEGRPVDAYMKVVKETRRKFYLEHGITDPRTQIKNYGEIVPETEFIMGTIESKIKAAQKAAQKREKIIGEFKKFYKKANSIKPDYGFNDVIKNPNFFTKDAYINSGEGIRRFLAANPNIKNPRDPEGKDYTAPEISVNGKKVLNFDLSKFDPDKLVIKNREDVDVKADRRFVKVEKDISEYPPEVQKKIKAYDELMNSPKVREFGYEAAKNEYIEECKQQYMANGEAKKKFIADHPNSNPKIIYAAEIVKDPILTQLYRPDLVKEMDVTLMNMSQLKESDSDVKYENDALTVINRALNEIREEAETDAYNPLNLPLPFDDPNGGKYFEGFEDYPKDLQEQIKVYDRIIASVPDDYGFNDFKKNVDYFDKISKEEYVAQGMGKQYFAQKHQMVNPRDAIVEAEKLAKIDAEIRNQPFDAKKFREDLFERIAVYDKKIKESKHDAGYDPRIDVPNYGRVVIHKSEYKPKHIFDDNERIRNNVKIIKEVEEYIDTIKKVQLDYGFQKYKPGDDVEKYVSKKEYCLSDAAKDLYIKEKNIANPIVKYAKFIDKDKELRAQIREVTKDYIEIEKRLKEDIKNWDDPDGEKEILRQRDIERAKTKNLYESQTKGLKEAEAIMYKSAVNFLNIKKYFDALKDSLSPEDVKDIKEKEENYMSTLTNYRNILELEENTYAPVRATKRYCDKLTIDNIEAEEKALEKTALNMGNEPSDQMKPKDDRVEGFCFNMRYKRLAELKREREIIKNNPDASEKHIQDLIKLDKDKTKLELEHSKDPDEKAYKKFHDMVFGQ